MGVEVFTVVTEGAGSRRVFARATDGKLVAESGSYTPDTYNEEEAFNVARERLADLVDAAPEPKPAAKPKAAKPRAEKAEKAEKAAPAIAIKK